ncbi:MAG: ABC transporter ATP-binding protein [Verrucomicrobia subdivision 3 bacterium]|nr:ABC transporter ATP-binding protein [Limisphaerales bacterium]
MAHGAPSSERDPTFAAKSRSTWEVVGRVAIYLRPYKLAAAATVTCAVLSLLASFAFPKLTAYAIDDVIRQGHAELLTPVMLGLIGAFLLRDLFSGLRILVNNHFEQNVIFDMRRDVYSRLQRLPVGYFDQRASGDLMTRVIEDVNSVERVLIDGTEQGVVALVGVLGVGAILIYTNPLLALVAMSPIPVLAAGAMWYTLTAHRRYRRQREASSAMNALLMDNLQGVRQIKAFSREIHEDQRFRERADALRWGTLGIMRVWAIYSPVMSFAGAIGFALVLWVGGRQVIQHQMEPGALVGYLLYLGMFYTPIGQLHGLNQLLQSGRAAGERVLDILDAPKERPDARARQPLRLPIRGEVIYENVRFSYDEGKTALHSINLHARPGEMIALVGPTGAGKSTVVNLLPAFYELTSGRILVDGQDIGGVALESLRQQISVVSQEPFLFNGTIRENILYGKLDATGDELLAAARAANCFEFITNLPEGFETRVGERGVKLSVGEKQRVSIARALLKNAPLLVLDEATASVDTATERLIQEALERLMANRTSFVIAHRLSTIRQADQILVLRHGQIIERGTHEELLAQAGLYARLARIQNTSTIEEGFTKLEVVP